MKICYLSENPLHIGKIMDYFASHGHDVSYITFKENSWENVANYHLLEPIPRSYFTYFLNLFHVRKVIKKIDPDVIHAYYLTNFGFLAAFSGFKPFVVSAVGTDALILPFKTESKNKIITTLINKIVRYVIRRAEVVIYMATHMIEKLTLLGAAPDKMQRLAEGVDLEKFNFIENSEHDKKKIRVISTRHFESVYNIELLIDAFPLVLSEFPDSEFILIGEGSLKDKLMRKAEDTGISGHISFKGFVDNNELPGYLNSSDIYVSASFSDGCSVSLLEAMACGAFPVVSDIPANRYVIEDGVSGYLFDVNSSQDLAEKILLAIKEKEHISKQRIKNREFIKNNFEMNLVMDNLLNIYKTMQEKLNKQHLG